MRTGKRWVLIGIVVGGIVLGACGGSGPSTGVTVGTIPARSTTTTTRHVATTTAPNTNKKKKKKVPPVTTTVPVAIPPDLQPTSDAAASSLVYDWSSNNRSAALGVATPQAVAVLFSVAYPGDLAIARGCSVAYTIVCTYGPPGGGPSTAPLYQFYMGDVRGGWYVKKTVIESDS